MIESVERILAVAVGLAWGPPLVALLVGGGLYLTVYCRFLPFLGAAHAVSLLRGREQADDRSVDQGSGQLTHFQALSTALASTIGLGNIGGVAIAITQGGPGAVFWMWVAALVGMATKFFSCTLAVMFRREDSAGDLQGGPMYYIEVGLGKRWRWAAILFSVCGLIGCLAIFQANQVAELLQQSYGIAPLMTGLVSIVVVAVVSFGGISRIGSVASRLVPSMCGLYLLGAVTILLRDLESVPVVFGQIFHDAFSGTAATGGIAGIAVAKVIQTGVKRAVFSNEAGLGTAPMAHGAARTTEPVREGLVAMVGPFIDTIVICSLTAFVILSTGLWSSGEGLEGVTLTSRAFEAALGPAGGALLVLVASLFGLSTMIGNSYYGRKCFAYLFGPERARLYEVFYLAMLLIGALWSASSVVNLIDTAYALMALPNMLATIWLAPKVMVATRDYFARRSRLDHPHVEK